VAKHADMKQRLDTLAENNICSRQSCVTYRSNRALPTRAHRTGSYNSMLHWSIHRRSSHA
jgi:hypothetical protein